MEPFFDNRHEQISTHGGPNLCFDGILTGPIESLYFEMLFDPLEEEFNLPTEPIDVGHRESREFLMVGQEDETSLSGVIIIRDPS